MPVHHWKGIDDGVFHDLHCSWISEIKRALNAGLLPETMYAAAEQREFNVVSDDRQNSVVIRHASDDKIIAVLEVVSRGNKTGRSNFETFIRKTRECLVRGIHLTFIDVHPPGFFDPYGIHGAMRLENGDDPLDLSPEKQLCAAGYEAGVPVNAYVNLFSAGDAIPPTPLYIRRDRYVLLPLEQTYTLAFNSYSKRSREKIEANARSS